MLPSGAVALNILFASEKEDPAIWLPRLRHALPQDKFFVAPEKDIDVALVATPPAVTHVRAGRLRAIAVTSAQRSPALPDVPTVNEQGFSGFDDLTWTAVCVAAGTSQDIVNRLNSELNRALSAPDVLERLGQLGLDWKSNTAGEFAAFLREEVQKWAKAVKDSGAKAD